MRLLARRWRLRTLMIIVAVVGVGLGGRLTIDRRRAEFQRRYDFHIGKPFEGYPWHNPSRRCRNATCAEYQAEGYPPTPSGYHQHPNLGLLTRADRAWLTYHEQMATKYAAAERRPWLPVAPDPPAPPQPPPYESRRVQTVPTEPSTPLDL